MPGGLMKAVIRPGGGDSSPTDGDQVSYFPFFCWNYMFDDYFQLMWSYVRNYLHCKDSMIKFIRITG